MALRMFRLQFDDEIPEHQVILDRLDGLSGLARSEFLRLHLFRAVVDFETRLSAATKRVEALQGGILARKERLAAPKKPRKRRGAAMGAAPDTTDVPPKPSSSPPPRPFGTFKIGG